MKNSINFWGIFFHFFSLAGFLFGAYVASFGYKYDIQNRRFAFNKKRFSILIYLYCLIGLFVVVWQVSTSTNIKDYLNELIYGFLFAKEIPSIRGFFLLERESGGLPGIIKMFSYAPLSALYIALTIKSLKSDSNMDLTNLMIGKHLFVIFIIILARALFTLDRLVLLSFLILMLYFFALNRQLKLSLFKNLFYYITLLAILTLLNNLSIVRQGTSFWGAFSEYTSLGLANLSILFECNFDYTWGLSSIFHIIYFPLKYIGLLDVLPNFHEAHWIWNPARYLTAYAYQDFGIFSIILFILFGFLSERIYLTAYCKNNHYAMVVLFALILVLITSLVVPIFRGMDWWISLFMGIIGIKFCLKHLNTS